MPILTKKAWFGPTGNNFQGLDGNPQPGFSAGLIKRKYIPRSWQGWLATIIFFGGEIALVVHFGNTHTGNIYEGTLLGLFCLLSILTGSLK